MISHSWNKNITNEKPGSSLLTQIFVRLRTILRKYLKKKDIHAITAIEMIEHIEDKYSSCEEVTNNKYELLRKAFIKLHAFQQRMQNNDIERYESR